MTFVPEGARGIVLKLNCPLRNACSDSFIFNLAALSIFNVTNACSRRRSHSEMVQLGSNKDNPASLF